MQYVRIPKDRVAVLIGTGGGVKRRIEEKTKTKITIEEGDITIEGDPVGELTAKDIAQAIGRGFSPETAYTLFKEDVVFELLPLMEILGSEKELARKKGRIIGRRGKTRAFIEAVTNTQISVYGKSIGIIGKYDDVSLAKEGIMRLLSGARHASVYKFLEKSRAQQREFTGSEEPFLE